MMDIRLGKKSDKREFLKTQKEAFPNLDFKRQSKYFDEKVKKKEIFIAEENKKYLGHHCLPILHSNQSCFLPHHF